MRVQGRTEGSPTNIPPRTGQPSPAAEREENDEERGAGHGAGAQELCCLRLQWVLP